MKIYFWSPISILAIAISSISFFFCSTVANADSMTWPFFWKDVLEDGFSWHLWKFPPSPAFFSEGLLFLFSRFLTPDFFVQMAIVSGLQALLVFLGGLLLLRSINQFSSQTILALALIICIGIAGTSFQHYWLFATMNNMHMGALIASICALALYFFFLEKPSLRKLALLGVICWFGTLDGNLFILSFSLPLLIYLWLQKWIQKAPLDRRLFGTIALSTFLGRATLKIISPWNALKEYEKTSLAGSIKNFLIGFYEIFHSHHWTAWLLTFFFIAGFVTAARKLIQQVRNRSLNQHEANLIVIILIINIVGIIADRKFHYGLYEFRYLIFPIFLGLLYSCRLFLNSIPSSVLACALLLGVAGILWANSKERPVSSQEMMVQCLENHAVQYGLDKGLSGYWNSKGISLLTQTPLRVRAVAPNMVPFQWMSNTQWFPASKAQSADPKYHFNFVIIDDWITAEKANTAFGKPDEVFECPTTAQNQGFYSIPERSAPIYVYRSDAVIKWAAQFAKSE